LLFILSLFLFEVGTSSCFDVVLLMIFIYRSSSSLMSLFVTMISYYIVVCYEIPPKESRFPLLLQRRSRLWASPPGPQRDFVPQYRPDMPAPARIHMYVYVRQVSCRRFMFATSGLSGVTSRNAGYCIRMQYRYFLMCREPVL